MLKWLVSLMQCRGRHHYMMHFLDERKTGECTRCGRIFPTRYRLIPASSGWSFTEMENDVSRFCRNSMTNYLKSANEGLNLMCGLEKQ